MKSNTLIAVEWLWSLRGKEMWLTPGVLTVENKDPASPNLTTVEAASLFRNLQEKGLIFTDVRDGRTVFRLHESKIQEWNAFMESFVENDLSAQIASNNPADGEGKKKTKNQLPALDVNDGAKPIPFFDSIFKLLAGIAFASWMVQEYVLPHNKFFLFLAIVCGLADVFYLFGHKILPHYCLVIVLNWSVYLGCICLIYKNPGDEHLTANADKSKPTQTFKSDTNALGLAKSSVSLEVGQVIDRKAPFGTSLVICNSGTQAISNIWAVFYWTDPKAKTSVYSHLVLNPTARLLPSMKQGLHFAPEDIKVDPPFERITFMEVDLRFTPAFSLETNQVYQFCIQRDSDNNYVWIPAGEGIGMKQLDDRISDDYHYRVIDSIPFLDVRIDAVEDVSKTYTNLPIRIKYTWKNIGGMPANNVNIEWATLTRDYAPYMFWHHETNTFITPLWPGGSNSVSRFYSESPSHDVYEGIMNGRLILIGAAIFNDHEGHKFEMRFKAIRTNDDFEIRYVGLGGYFQELEKTLKATNNGIK